MNRSETQVESEWATTLSGAEDDINRILSTVPKPKVLGYTRDLVTWANRIADDNIAKALRILVSLGHSKAEAATILGVSPSTINRVLAAREVKVGTARSPRSTRVPIDPIDIRDRFEAMGEG